jgi:hypothetical protein
MFFKYKIICIFIIISFIFGVCNFSSFYLNKSAEKINIENTYSSFYLQNIKTNKDNLNDKLYLDYIDRNSLSVGWNMAYAKINNEVGSVAGRENVGKNIFFKPDGRRMYIVGEDSFTSGTSGYLTGGINAESDYSVWEAIIDGSFLVTIDGIKYNVTGIDFTGVTDMDDVASVIEQEIQRMTGRLETCVWDTDHFLISSILGDASSSISVLSTINYGTVGTDISGMGVSDWMDSDTGNGTPTSGTSNYGGSRLQEFMLAIPWDTSTLRYNTYYDYSANSPFIDDCKGLIISPDGTRIFLANAWEGSTNPEHYYSYTMSTAWDLSTISYDNKSYDFSSDGINAHGMSLDPDGYKLYVADYGHDGGATHIIQYTFGTAYDLDTLSKDSAELDTNSEIYRLNNFVMSSDGTKIIAISKVTDYGDHNLFQYDLSTPFDLNSGSYSGNSWHYNTEPNRVREPSGNYITVDGNYLFLLGIYSDHVYRLRLGTPNTLESVYYANRFSVVSQNGDQQGVAISQDGLHVYSNSYSGYVFQYDLNIAWDIRSASYSGNSFNFSGTEANMRSVTINNDGSKIYLMGSQTDKVYEINLSTPYDLNTASYNSVYFSISEAGTYPMGLSIGNDGSKMYVVNAAGYVYQYSINSAWDLSNVSYDSKSLNASAYTSDERGVSISGNGNYLYISDASNHKIYQFYMSTPYDLSTASYNTYFLTNILYSVSPRPRGLAFKPNGNAFYIMDPMYDVIFQAEINLPVTYLPVFDINAGTYYNDFNVEITSETEGATIYYTTDGSDPTPEDNEYNGLILINHSLTLKAIAVKEGYNNSNISSVTYVLKVSAPEISVQSGTYYKYFFVEIISETEDATIYYNTTNFTNPLSESQNYMVLIDSNVTLKAVATKNGYFDSNISSATYVLDIEDNIISSNRQIRESK